MRGIACAVLMFAALTLSQAQGATTSCDDIAKPKCVIRPSTGISMAYLEAGPANGEGVILLHGLTDSSRSWSLAMRALRARKPDLHIFALDLRGHGASSMPPAATCAAAPERCFRMAEFADDVVAFMHDKNIGRATFVGHSMGSFVAQEMALAHPEMASRIVLVATSTKVAGNAIVRDYVLNEPVEGAWKRALQTKRITYPAGAYALTPKDADPNVEEWLTKAWDADPIAAPELLTGIVPETARVKLGAWIGATRALLATDNTERLKSLRVPALVLWGAQDNTFFATDQSALKDVLAAAASSRGTPYSWKQYGVIPLPPSGTQEADVGHAIPWEAPREIAADIVSFIMQGKPTPDLYRASVARGVKQIITEPGKAVIVRGP